MKTSEQNDTIQATETAPEFGHTPGPWHWERSMGAFEIWPKDHGQTHSSIGRVYKQTDARLIAAAPELLAALVRLEEGVRLWMSKGVEDRDMEAARAAIAKAKGQL